MSRPHGGKRSWSWRRWSGTYWPQAEVRYDENRTGLVEHQAINISLNFSVVTSILFKLDVLFGSQRSSAMT